MPASELVIVSTTDRATLDAVRAVIEASDDAEVAYVDDAVLSLAAAPGAVAADVLRARLAALDGVDAAYVKPPDALP